MQTQSLALSTGWRRPLWIALLVAASVAFTLGFACATRLLWQGYQREQIRTGRVREETITPLISRLMPKISRWQEFPSLVYGVSSAIIIIVTPSYCRGMVKLI
jgi:hypothetical protein